MSKLSLKLQREKLGEIENIQPYQKKLVGIKFTVLPRVYGTGTDTELLCKSIDVRRGERVWDIGTGTGLVALYAKKKGAGYVLASDKNPQALKNAKLNSKALKLNIQVRKADVFDSVNDRFDIITFNPPFTDHVPKKDFHSMFWDKGNIATKKFFDGLRNHLAKGGRAFICWSSFGSRTLLKQLARENSMVITHEDRKRGGDKLYYDVYRLMPVVPHWPRTSKLTGNL